ncbi:MAG: HAMP domain-containing protein [Deltaproteobacteria bacterium]|nr:HAMP domain-containing protein [Deltaproteobacteria bacterium]
MTNILSRLSLKTKLLLMMLSLCVLFIVSLYVLYARAEKDLIDEVRKETEELTTAFQISVEEISKTDEDVDIEKFKQLIRSKKRGMREISVVNSDKEVIASSNAAVIGKKLNIKADTDKPGGNVVEYSSNEEGQMRYDILLPIVVDRERLGYIHLATEFDDLSYLVRKNHINRLIATLVIFTIGIAAAMYLSKRYTDPIKEIADAAHKVAAGDLSCRLPVRGGDEIGRLTQNFNDMVVKLGERMTLEERLKGAEHMSKIGTLASGIAHEVRNPLNLIALSIDQLRVVYAPEDSLRKKEFDGTMAVIKSEIERLDGMVSNFLNFGRPLKLSLKGMALGPIVEETLSLLSESCAERKITIEMNHLGDGEAGDAGKSVLADYRHLKTCFLNVFLNAIQSMPEGGVLRVESAANDGFATVKVHDTGCGISPENLGRVFDPYFTTKDIGIGIGLALTKRVIEEHGGSISIVSELDRGTTVCISLPVST